MSTTNFCYATLLVILSVGYVYSQAGSTAKETEELLDRAAASAVEYTVKFEQLTAEEKQNIEEYDESDYSVG
jgi:hypothetical protein